MNDPDVPVSGNVAQAANLIVSRKPRMRWISNPLNSPKARALEAALDDSKLKISASALPVLADLLVGRGIDEPEAAARFLSPALGDLSLIHI